ncbi:hypothetical protein DsansV1_C03g0024811 [Dioscorea sansibarensis]
MRRRRERTREARCRREGWRGEKGWETWKAKGEKEQGRRRKSPFPGSKCSHEFGTRVPAGGLKSVRGWMGA